jgi:catechol 2,3-dioxygenase-like lactoylglutathione lyase family enzyme
MPPELPPLAHVGLVVPDLAAAAANFERRWGARTERVAEMTFEGASYLGGETELSARYGFIATGGSELELIEPLSRPSPYADFLDADGGQGIHHLAYVVEAIDPHLERLCLADGHAEILLDAPIAGGGRFVYVGGAAPGTVVELIELSEQLRLQMVEGGGS